MCEIFAQECFEFRILRLFNTRVWMQFLHQYNKTNLIKCIFSRFVQKKYIYIYIHAQCYFKKDKDKQDFDSNKLYF